MSKFSALRYSEWSLKRKLFLYMLLLTVLLLAILTIGLVLFGRTSTTAETFRDSLDLQMEVFEKDISVHFDHLAASAVTLSEDMTAVLEKKLNEYHIDFSSLNDQSEIIYDMQANMIEPMRQKLLHTNCSGVFVMLNATVNSKLPESSVSRTGLYLQINGYDHTRSDMLLYRGMADIAQSHRIMPHRKWRLEFRTDLFPDYAGIVSEVSFPPDISYRVTELFKLPGTSENALLLTVPMMGDDGTYYGLCGYEVSASYFMTYHEQPSKLPHLSCLLAAKHDNILITSESLSCGSRDAYFHTLTEDYAILKIDNGFTVLRDDKFTYLGLTQTIKLSPGDGEHLLVVMVPKKDFDRALYKSMAQTVFFLVLLLFFTVSFCKFFSRRFLTPLLSAIDRIKSDRRNNADFDIPEILDLIEYLDRQEKERDEKLISLEKKHLMAENEKIHLQAKYDSALREFRRVEEEYHTAKEDLMQMQSKMDRLAYSRKTEIDPADYQFFIAGLQTLTESERNLFEHYLAGKSVKEILEITGIKESTLKYHNHNLLGKLGVSSRKQMLRYAEVMRHQKEEAQAK